jgi:hypothetical protein
MTQTYNHSEKYWHSRNQRCFDTYTFKIEVLSRQGCDTMSVDK